MDTGPHRPGQAEAEFLAEYDPARFERPSLTVDMVICTVASAAEENYRKLPAKELQVLLVQRPEHPFQGWWALPGGFVTANEGLDAAAARTLRRETHIDGIYLEQLYTWGEVDRDPRTRVISCSYLSLIDATALPVPVQAGTGAAAVRWFTLGEELVAETRSPPEGLHTQTLRLRLVSDDIALTATLQVVRRTVGRATHTTRSILDSDGVAFDHARIIQYALERLRNKIDWTDVAFNLMPAEFTLTELQQVYEVILQRELLAANFRRKIEHLVVPTNHYKKDAGHRPARLYRRSGR